MGDVRSVLAVVLLIGGMAFPTASSAQGTADIVGRVTDSSDAVLPGASVTVTNAGTNATRNTVTGDTGDYVFTLLPIGTYTVKIELQGFQTQTTRVVLTTNDRVRVNGRLSVGTLSESLVVSGESPLLQTDQSSLSTLVTEQAVQDLPVNGRNFIRLVQLIPGAVEGDSNAINSGNRADDRRPTSAVSINGAGENMNNEMVDGMDNNERSIGTIIVRPSMDAIAEIRVQTNLYLAETGRTGGGIINILTKSGTNQFHGSAYEFRRDASFDERNYFETTDPVLDQNQFGGSFGGPIVANRTFFFGDYEQLRSDRGQVNNVSIPTMKMRTGDFSELLPGTVIYDPTTTPRTPFEGNIIPTGRLDAIALKYMSILPATTSAGVANNLQSVTPVNTVTHTTDGRIDHRFNENNSLFARYSYNKLDLIQGGPCLLQASSPYPNIAAVCRAVGTPGAGFPGPNHTKAHAFQANYVRVFSPTLIGEFKAGYNMFDLTTLPTNYNTNAGDIFGIPNSNLPDFANGRGLPLFNIDGFIPLGDSANSPIFSHTRAPQFAASLTKTMGAHSIKAGGGVILREFGVVQSSSALGTFGFTPNLTRSSTNQGGYSVASLMLGYPTNVSRQHSPFEPKVHTNEPSFYIQDDWRTTNWLTLNIGLRYDTFTPYNDENGMLANLDWTLPQPFVMVAGENGVSDTAGVKTDYSNVQPRVGFAATLPRGTVVRGGYGLTFFPANLASGYYLKNPPLFDSYGPVTSAGDSGGAPNLFLKDGLPPFVYGSRPDVSPSVLSGTVRPVSVDFKSNRFQQFNVQVEKDFAGNVVTVGYVGSRGDRMASGGNIDLAPVGPGAIQPRRAFSSVLPNVTNISAGRNTDKAQYDALQIVVQRRFTGGLSLNSHVRWLSAEGYASVPWDPNVFEWTEVANNVGHAFVFQANYALPFGQSMTGFTGGLVRGWQVNAVANWQGGGPFNVSNSSARANTGGGDRPNKVGDPVLPKDERTVQRWFNTAAYVAQPANTLGDAPALIMHGPPQRRLDLAVFKQVGLGGGRSLQLRYELYNVTNTANFQNPSGALGGATYGTISSTGNAIPRQMQFAVKFLF